MFDDIVKDFKETILNIPPIFRCSFLLLLADLVAKELPEAEKALKEEIDRSMSLLLEVAHREEGNND